ncbi:hypothetical protein J2Y39_004459 [Pseudomonas sp. 2957]|uniref:Uncharacterized protein n=1 Tax=Pseudomonas fluorescens TaxID=294 RepID=A0A5E7I2T1_PSEFL|nr:MULTISPECIES: hypothetical protein [Pseudomonas]MDR6949834.1 hypothetical protein [Pseudomonas sp. 2957]VVO69912.1 hypothetical protein PS847_01251 [Pseudomonas fluorescens]
MSDTEDGAVNFDPEKFRVSYDDFIRFLDGVSMSMVCPHCGTSGEWNVFTGNADGSDDQVLTTYKMPIAGTNFYRMSFAMSCENCGTYRSIYTQRVISWILDNPPAAEI